MQQLKTEERKKKIDLLNQIRAGQKNFLDLADKRLQWRIKANPDHLLMWFIASGKEVDYKTFFDLFNAQDVVSKSYVISDDDFQELRNTAQYRKPGTDYPIKYGLNLKYHVQETYSHEQETEN